MTTNIESIKNINFNIHEGFLKWLDEVESFEKDAEPAIMNIIKDAVRRNGAIATDQILISVPVHKLSHVDWYKYIEYINTTYGVKDMSNPIYYNEYEYYCIMFGKVFKKICDNFDQKSGLKLQYSFVGDNFSYFLIDGSHYRRSVTVRLILTER